MFGAMVWLATVVIFSSLTIWTELYIMKSQWQEGRWHGMPFAGFVTVCTIMIAGFLLFYSYKDYTYRSNLRDSGYDVVGKMPNGDRIFTTRDNQLCIGKKADDTLKPSQCWDT